MFNPSRSDRCLVSNWPRTLLPAGSSRGENVPSPPLARRDRHDPAAHAALAGQADVVHPVAGPLDSPAVAITASERRATGAPPSGRPAPMPRRPLPRSLTRVHVWLDEDGFTTDEAGERAFLTYAAIEGALVFAKAQRSAEPIERVHAQLPSVLRRNSKDRRRT